MKTTPVEFSVSRLALASVLVLATLTLPAQAQEIKSSTRQSSHLYYLMGGGNPASLAANPNAINLKFGLSGKALLSYSCGKFKVGEAFTYYMTEFKNLGATLQSAIGAAVAALPMYIFQRAQPGLYDLFHTYWAKAQLTISAALKSCEEMEAMIANKQDPYEAYAQLAKSELWKFEVSTSEDNPKPNPLQAKENVTQKGGTEGIQMTQKVQLGGKGQPPVRPTHDMTWFGFNVTMGQLPGADIDAVFSGASRLEKLWDSPSKAVSWTVSVLGDQEVATCPETDCGTGGGGTGKATVAGLGLLPKYQAAVADASAAFSTLVSSGDTSFSNLELVSAPGVQINKDVIDSIRRLPPESRGVVTQRLANEVALANTIERALMARNLLLTGMTVVNYEKPVDDARKRVEQLNRYIDDLLFEHRVRKEIVSSTAQLLIQNDQGTAALRSSSVPVGRESSTRLLENGSVK